METKAKLDKLTNRLRKIRQKLRALPQKREELETVFNELRAGWPKQLAKNAIGELSEEQLSEYRRELAVADRNRRELSELEAGLLALEKQVMNEMRPIEKKLRKIEAEKQYQALKARLQAGNYDKDEIGTFRQVAHEIGKDHECSELLRRIEHVRNREMKFSEVYGLRPEGVNDAV